MNTWMASAYSAILLFTLLLHIASTDGQSCKFGRLCRFPCRCQNKALCDSGTGECPGGCADSQPADPSTLQRWPARWTGPGCQVGNFLYQKSPDPSSVSALAIDGDLTTCLHAGKYWIGNFPAGRYVVLGFSIDLHPNTKNQLWDAYLGVGDSDDLDSHKTCAHIGRGDLDHNLDTQFLTKNCSKPLVGNSFSFRTTHTNVSLSICEIIVSGYLYRDCRAGIWGPGCLKVCNCEQYCDTVTGACPEQQCDPGWAGNDCQAECPDYRWGVGCNRRCTCANQAEVCNKIDGSCVSGCADGLRGPGSGCTQYSFVHRGPEEGGEIGDYIPVIVVAGIAAVLFILVFVLLIFVYLRLRKVPHQQTNPGHVNTAVNNPARMNPPTYQPMATGFQGGVPNPAFHGDKY